MSKFLSKNSTNIEMHSVTHPRNTQPVMNSSIDISRNDSTKAVFI